MSKKDLEFSMHDDQVTLSADLLKLMRWITKHNPHGLKRLIDKAVARGLAKHEKGNLETDISNFFMLMELLLDEALHKQGLKNALQKDTLSCINRIDTTGLDAATVQGSLENATSRIQSQPNANPNKVLMKELLKRWKPNKKQMH